MCFEISKESGIGNICDVVLHLLSAVKIWSALFDCQFGKGNTITYKYFKGHQCRSDTMKYKIKF